MNTFKKYKPGLIFFCIAVVLITIININPLLVPTQDAGSDRVYTIPGIPGDVVATQEITLKKDWINGMGLLFSMNGRLNTNDNVILVLNSDYHVLYRKTFSSKQIRDNQYYPLNFNKSIKAGKGMMIYLCHYSTNGEENNFASVYCKPYSTLGKLYVSPIPDNDVFRAVQNKTKPLFGSFAIKTYESNFNTSLIFKFIFYFLAACLSLVIIYYRFIFHFISRIQLKPEVIFALLSSVFGTVLIFLTPPMQVPDEQSHFDRAYQISEFNVLKTHQTLPSSILHLDTIYQHMKFYSGEKTSCKELMEMTGMKLEPGIRLNKGTNDYIIPYIPAAIGIFIGRVMNFSPVILLFLGRLFNLLFGTFIIFLAIRIVPVHKWIFFLLGLLPMALFMRASLSYDVAKTGFSFLLIALLLQYAYDDTKTIRSRDILFLFVIVTCLALSKVPYFIPAMVFLLIPVKKLGSSKKYILLFLSIMIIPAIAIWLSSLVMTWSTAHMEVLGERAYGIPSFTTLGSEGDQIRFILANIPMFISILLKTIFVFYGHDYLVSFIGNLGWLDTPLPSFLIVSWYLILFFTAIGSSENDINPGWKLRILPLFCFISAVVIIETILYIVVSPYKGISVNGVQGRYFIPYAPLFLIIFYNVYVSKKLNLALSFRRNEVRKLKANEQSVLMHDIQKDEQVFSKSLHFFLVCFSVLTLLFTVYIVAYRYYFIGEPSASVETRLTAEKIAKMNFMTMQENQLARNRFSNLAMEAAKAKNADSLTYYLEKVVELDPSDIRVAEGLAKIYLQLKKKDKALKVIEKMKANGLEISKDLQDLTK